MDRHLPRRGVRQGDRYHQTDRHTSSKTPLFTDRQISSRCFSMFFCLLIAIDLVDTVNAEFGLNLTYSQKN